MTHAQKMAQAARALVALSLESVDNRQVAKDQIATLRQESGKLSQAQNNAKMKAAAREAQTDDRQKYKRLRPSHSKLHVNVKLPLALRR